VRLETRSTARVRRRRRREGTHWRRQQGVGEVVGAPAVDGDVRSDVGEVEEAACSSLVSRGGLLRRRAPCTGGGDDLAIGGLRRLIERVRWSRRVSVRRRREWCAQSGRRGAPFIVARRGRGAAVRSSSITRLQGQWWTGDDAREWATSWR
jgi:hypothetical protein